MVVQSDGVMTVVELSHLQMQSAAPLCWTSQSLDVFIQVLGGDLHITLGSCLLLLRGGLALLRLLPELRP